MTLAKITPISGSTTVGDMYNRIDSILTDRYELVQFSHLSVSHFTQLQTTKMQMLAELKAQMPTFSRTDFVLIEYPQPVGEPANPNSK